MKRDGGYRYDVFISYAAADRDWVSTVLLPRLEAAGLKVAIDYRDFLVGSPLLQNIEDMVAACRRTIVVLSPEWLASEWNAFEALLLRTADPAATRRKLLPLRLRPCELPDALARLRLDVADLTAERYKEAQLKRLLRDVADATPVPRPVALDDWQGWRRWLTRYRRGVRWAAALVLVLLAGLAMALQVFPFQPRPAWVQIAGPFPEAWRLHNTGQTLLVGPENNAAGCDQAVRGIWRQAAGDSFQPSEIEASLCVERWNPKGLSAVAGFASDPAHPGIVYALTSHSGVLVSHDGGAHFALAAPPPPPSSEAQGALAFAVRFAAPISFWVAGKEDGLWRYRGGAWTEMDGGGPGACAGLPRVRAGALLAHGARVLIGTAQRGLWVTEDDGAACRGVFDAQAPSQYDFVDVLPLAPASSERYLVLAWDGMSTDGAPGELIELCARPGLCTAERWEADPPLWKGAASPEQLLILADQVGEKWYMLGYAPFPRLPFPRIWVGRVSAGGPVEELPAVPRCLGKACAARLAPAGPGEPPYLLAAGRIYRYEVAPWWRRVWP